MAFGGKATKAQIMAGHTMAKIYYNLADSAQRRAHCRRW